MQPHAMYPEHATPDDAARERFVTAWRRFVRQEVAPGRRIEYALDVEPAFVKSKGRLPSRPQEVIPLLDKRPYWQMWSAMQMAVTDYQFEVVGERVEAQLDQLIEKAAGYRQRSDRLGSLQLNESVEIPRYVSHAADVHRMPGNYHSELCPDDVSVGALYETVGKIHFLGAAGVLLDQQGQTSVDFIKAKFPDLKPRRILDMGCAIGNTALPFVDAFPDAEVYGIDISAAQLRYGHARAEALGKKLHLSQQNAEETDFPDGYFDLVVSHLLLHETSAKALPRIFKESFRLLASKGVMTHSELGLHKHMSTMFDRIADIWVTDHLNEAFWTTFHSMENVPSLVAAAGFDPSRVFEELVSGSAHPDAQARSGSTGVGPSGWLMIGAVK